MATMTSLDALILVPGDLVAPGLESAASGHDWPIVKSQPLRPLLREVAARRPRLVVVQVGPPLHDAVDLIERIKEHWPGLILVAAAVAHHEQIEMAARYAGATLYLPDVSDGAYVEQSIASLLDPKPMTLSDPSVSNLSRTG